jgi:hypothetical protein
MDLRRLDADNIATVSVLTKAVETSAAVPWKLYLKNASLSV